MRRHCGTAVQQLVKNPHVIAQSQRATMLGRSGAVRWMGSQRPAPLLTASPVRAAIDEPICIKAQLLRPHCPVTLCAQVHSEDGDLWKAFGHYYATADGTVNLSRDHSVGGSYLGCELMGLFWALQPASGEPDGLRLWNKDVETPHVVHISLLDGHVSPGDGQGPELAAVTAERWYTAPGVRRIGISQNGIVGTLFLPPGPGPFPAMLDLWGFGGGLVERRSALFASRGYASLSLAQMLSSVNVSDSYYQSAFRLLRDHPQVCADRVGICGLSFGGYLSLRIATQRDVKPSCVVCINGPVGNPIKFLDDDARTENVDTTYSMCDHQGYVVFREATLPEHLDPETIVKIENLACPLLYIVGEDDHGASSVRTAKLIEETLRDAGKAQLFTRLSYPGAGHLIEPPYMPNARTSVWVAKPKKLMALWGGHLAPHAAAQEDAWRKILDFMETNLRQ